jgi:hypothetical protein
MFLRSGASPKPTSATIPIELQKKIPTNIEWAKTGTAPAPPPSPPPQPTHPHSPLYSPTHPNERCCDAARTGGRREGGGSDTGRWYEGPKTYQDHQGGKNKNSLTKLIWHPMAFRIGLPGSSRLQNYGHIKPVILQCRTLRETNDKIHWVPILFLINFGFCFLPVGPGISWVPHTPALAGYEGPKTYQDHPGGHNNQDVYQKQNRINH